jgi:hypothetical protein
MPTTGGGQGVPGDPPKRPAEPKKQGGVSSPSEAAASREAALAKSKAAAEAAAEAEQDAGAESGGKRQLINRIGIVFIVLTLVAGLAWYVVMPYFGIGGDDRFVKVRRSNPNADIYRPVFDASAITVDSASLSIRTGDAGLSVLKGIVRNGGMKSARNIKITFKIVSGAEPLEVTHTVTQEIKPGKTFEFSMPLSFDVPQNAEIKAEKVEIH